MSSPFLSPQFKAWSEQVAKEGSRLACVVKLNSGDIVTYGDYEWGLKTFTEKITVKKRKSGEWVPNQEKLIKMKKPLSETYKDLNFVKLHAAYTLNLFMDNGARGKYGEGENFMWDFQVDFKTISFTHDVLKNQWKSDVISLSDVIDWKNFKIRSFGVKPKSELFKIPISWRNMCLMIIEIGYNILKLDVNSPSTEPTLSSSEVSLVALASHGTQADSAAGAGTTASLGDKTVPDMVVGAQKVVNKTSIEVNNDVASHYAPEKLRWNITDISDMINLVL